MQKYYNPRLHNAVVAGTGMEHPRRPHVVLGSELNGYVQGDLVDANGICDLIHEKSTNTLARLDSLESSLKNETKARTQDKDNIIASLNTLIADKLGSTETVQGESAERQAGDAALQLQIDEQNTNYTTVQTAVNDLTTSVNNKQDALVGGTNIKNLDDGTGNTISLLGSGNVSFKTINGQSIIGSDDIEVSSGGCDCIYQVIIKHSYNYVAEEHSFEIQKGDYATAASKLSSGEYVDIKVVSLSTGENGSAYYQPDLDIIRNYNFYPDDSCIQILYDFDGGYFTLTLDEEGLTWAEGYPK